MKTSVLNYAFTTILLLFFFSDSLFAEEQNTTFTYELAVSIDIDARKIVGTAHVVIPPEEEVTVYLDDLDVTSALLQTGSNAPSIIILDGSDQITIPSEKIQQELFISYEKRVTDSFDNYIDKKGVSLLHSWFPGLNRDSTFTLDAQLPKGFKAISETDKLLPIQGDVHKFAFSQPVNSLHLVAAPYIINTIEVRPGLMAYTYFLPDDQDLSAGYLENAKKFLLRYEKLIGTYPYNHFAIVENIQPTGYGMPTFTLLGSTVIRLPFIKDTSLGHEILHSWFGNGIGIKQASGNWSEGLTSYLADWLYREDKGEGAENRRENMLKFFSHVTKESSIPLGQFTSASHNQPMARSVRAVGYIRSAMLFHELKQYTGKDNFTRAIAHFYSKHKYKRAGWSDIRSSFEQITGKSLKDFFEPRLTMKDVPKIELGSVHTHMYEKNVGLHFSIKQTAEYPLAFSVPLQVITTAGEENFNLYIDQEISEIELDLNSPPVEIILDPRLDLLRHPSDEERSPTLSYFMGPRAIKVITDESQDQLFSNFIKTFGVTGWEVVSAAEIKNSALAKNDLVLLGSDNSIKRILYGSEKNGEDGFILEGRKNPLNTDHYVLLVSASSKDQVDSAVRKLRHYGKYSYLALKNGRAADKKFEPAKLGIRYRFTVEPTALPTKQIMSFDDTVNNISKAKVIYIGETHTSMRDHNLQYRIIEKLHLNNKDLAIGMEMFPRSSQKALDHYISGDRELSEKDFLKESRYFDVWGFDFRYYRRIINFAKANSIPLIGLNIERNVVNSIFRNGSLDKLNPEQLEKLPKERDLSLPGYYQRLQNVHGAHLQGGHGGGNLSGFIQAQAAWDEVMAETITNYLQKNPEKQMVVLAGSQHTRNDSGIPPRVKRRMDIPQIGILSSDSVTRPEGSIADYVFFSDEEELPPPGKIGVSLEEKGKDKNTYLEIIGFVEKGYAEKSGLLVGDKLLRVNGYPIKNMEDIRIAMVGALPEEDIEIEVRRYIEEEGSENRKIWVRLHEAEN